MIIDHSVMETENYRKTVRKSLAHIYGNIEAIEDSGARVLGKNIVYFLIIIPFKKRTIQVVERGKYR